MFPIGIMQGRLLPPVDGRFQAFPAAGWRDEFEAAQQAGLVSIEWIYELPNDQNNPVGSDEGIDEMDRISKETGVLVRSICADYYMEQPLVIDGQQQIEQKEHLKWLLRRAEKMRVQYIVLPFVDQSSLRSKDDVAALQDMLDDVLPDADRVNVELHLETDLKPEAFAALLANIDHPKLKANYDIGNSASLGYNQGEELSLLGPWLGSVHVKDRVLGGGTVPLGTGCADFPTCFRSITAAGYDRPYILQAARDVDGGEVSWARQNREFIERQLTILGE